MKSDPLHGFLDDLPRMEYIPPQPVTFRVGREYTLDGESFRQTASVTFPFHGAFDQAFVADVIAALAATLREPA